MFRPNFKKLYHPSDIESPAPKADLGEKGVLDILNTLEDEEADVNDKKDDLDLPDLEEKKVAKSDDDDEEEDEDDELEDIELNPDDEDDDEEPEEDELKLLIPVARKEILKTYPDLFKKFPALERAMYREQAFTEVYPTVKEAKESVEQLNSYKELESSILDGNIEVLLKNVKERDSEAINRIADNYLTSLYQVDRTAYDHVINNVYKYTIKSIVDNGKATKNDDLIAVGEALHKIIFGNTDFVEPTKLSKPVDEKKSEVEKEREEWLKERFEEASNELGNRVDNRLRSSISQALESKDLSEYVKTKVIEDCIAQLHKQIGSDSRTQKIINGLWKQSRSSKFSKESVNKIGVAYLSVSKSLLLPIIRENLKKAISGAKRLGNDKDEKVIVKKEKFKGSNDDKGERTTPKGKMKPGESIESFLLRD